MESAWGGGGRRREGGSERAINGEISLFFSFLNIWYYMILNFKPTQYIHTKTCGNN